MGSGPGRGGRSATSVLNLPQFRTSWRDVTRVSKDVTTGMTEKEAAAVVRHERPILVYVYNDEKDDDARFAIEEAAAFANDKVAVGARFFDCVRLDLETAKSDRMLKEHLGRQNSLLFVRPDYSVANAMHFKGSKLAAAKVFGAMCKTMKLDYSNCVKSAYSKMQKLQKSRVKLDREMVKVNQLDEKIVAEKSAKKREKMIKERDKEQEKLDAQYAKIDEKMGKLFALQVKEKAEA